MNLKSRTFSLLIALGILAHVHAQELPLLSRLLPDLGRDWVRQKQGTKKSRDYEYSWITYTNSKTGDTFSFAADKYLNTTRTVGSNPTRESTLDMFPGGPSRDMQDGPVRWGIIDTLRLNVVPLETGATLTRKNEKADTLEFSYVYENEDHAIPNRLGHGYVLAFGDTCVFLQHTSARVISSDDARSAAISILVNHLTGQPKP